MTTKNALAITDLINDTPRLWTGLSGEQVTGEQVTHYYEAVIALLERDGWERVPTRSDEGDDLDVNDSMTVKDMLRTIIRWMKSETHTSPWNLPMALAHIANTDDGDDDTYGVCSRLLDIVIRARTGEPYANAYVWASKLGRTWPEAKQLLADAANVARTYGPTT